MYNGFPYYYPENLARDRNSQNSHDRIIAYTIDRIYFSGYIFTYHTCVW